jgi:H+-translocating NAD(P) transhydrogenase subunit beta
VNALIVLGVIAAGTALVAGPEGPWGYVAFGAVVLIGLVLGVTSVIPIGGADMPVVISLLNSYSGIAAATAGFIILNNVLIVAGCARGRERDHPDEDHVQGDEPFAGECALQRLRLGRNDGRRGGHRRGETDQRRGRLLRARSRALRRLRARLRHGRGPGAARGARAGRAAGAERGEVKYCIHPVAGRMPGHMNVLLAEANVPYEQLVEPGDVNPSSP